MADETLDEYVARETKRLMNSPPYYSNTSSLTWSPTAPSISSASLYTTSPKKENKMNAEVKVAQIKAGYVGQLWVAGKVAWESVPKKSYAKANNAAARHLIEVFA